MGLLIMANRGHYTNADAVNNVVRYITRTRINEDRQKELIYYNGFGVVNYLTPAEMISQMCMVQEKYRISVRGGRRIYHEFFLIGNEEFYQLNRNMEYVKRIAAECSRIYYDMGFQVVYAIHRDKEKKLHIHFCVNTINFNTGMKWHSSHKDLHEREMIFNTILYRYMNLIIPIQFINPNRNEVYV